jgi:WD40 repeat protein
VIASPPSTVYRLRKFGRKHKGALGTLVTVALFLNAALLVSTLSYFNVERQRQVATARELVAYADESLLEDPERSVILAMFAVDASLHQAPAALASSENALHAAVLSSHVRITFSNQHSLGLALSPDGKRFATTSGSTAKILDGDSGREILTLRGHRTGGRTEVVTYVAFSSDGTRIATAGEDTVKIWDAASGQELLTLHGHHSGTNDVAFSPDGGRLAIASSGGVVKLWSTSSGQELLTLSSLGQAIASVAFSPGGNRVAAASSAKVKLWDVASGRELLVLPDKTVDCIAFSPDGKRLATGTTDGTVRVWDANSGRESIVLRGHGDWVMHVAFSGDGKRLITASWDGTAKVWDIASGKEQLTLRGHVGPVVSAVFYPDGNRVTTVGSDGTVMVWDVSSDRELITLRGIEGGVRSLAFSPDGKSLAAATPLTTKVWDATSGEELPIWPPHKMEVGGLSVAFSPDGKQLVTPGSTSALSHSTDKGRVSSPVAGTQRTCTTPSRVMRCSHCVATCTKSWACRSAPTVGAWLPPVRTGAPRYGTRAPVRSYSVCGHTRDP